MSAAKWIFGGLGFVLGGPIGALVGVLIGSLFESPKAISDGSGSSGRGASRSRLDEARRARSSANAYRAQNRRASQNDIKVSLLVLIACVMKADGHVKKAELDVVKRFLVRNYGEQGALSALQVLKGLLEQDIDHAAVAEQIADNLNYSTRFELLHFLLELAFSDGIYDAGEEQIIISITRHLGLSMTDYNSLLALYRKNEDPDWAYKALEVEPSATDEEIKKAYRRVAMKYHPDKVASAGEEIKAKATEKFQEINKAYEFIKNKRGMN